MRDRSRPLVILGSSRSDGETRRAISIAFSDEADCLDLSGYNFTAYDYDHANKRDDFSRLADHIIPRNAIVFATPVYWYAMSAQMKTFFDRLSDLVTIEKSKGRSLSGKMAWLIATGTDADFPDGFEIPFSRTCDYFDIHYRGACYLNTSNDRDLRTASEMRMRRFGASVLAEMTSKCPD